VAICEQCGGDLFYKAEEGSYLEEYCLHCNKRQPTVVLMKDGTTKQKPVKLPWGEPDDGRIGTLSSHNGSTYVWSTSGWVLAGKSDEGFVWPGKKPNPNSRRAAILAQRERNGR
jgi:hypothetical protein